MKKYIAIVMRTVDVPENIIMCLETRIGDTREYLEEWIKLIPHNGKSIIIENSEELQEVFSYFMDYTPVTEEEKKEMEKAKRIYERIMGKHDD